jgi:eukaryotic-like serine/threonine-protein kinase
MSEADTNLPVIDERYACIKVIGDGGMGVVYLARHVHVGKLVAIKVMSREAADHPGMFERFQLEAQAAALIAHTNIVECYDVGHTTHDGLPFLVFEYLEGSDLLEEMTGVGPMPVRRVLRIGKQVASALASAHAKGIIHRDLKPENVFLTFREDNPDHVKLLDFGISKFMRARSPTPSSPTAIGTPHYMAPEQFADADAIDGRADTYAFGVLLYRMLAGRTPYAHVPQAELLQKMLHERPASLRTARPDLPRALHDLIDRCLRADVNHRPAMDEVFNDLTDLSNAGVATPLPVDSMALTTPLVPIDTPLPLAAESRPAVPPPARGSSLRTPLIGLGAGLVIGAAIYAFAARSNAPDASKVAASAPAPAPAPAPPPPAVVEPVVPDTVAIAVVSSAPGAKVVYRGESFDLPIALEIDRGEHPELIEVTAPTFQGRRYWVTFDKPRRIVAKLKAGRGVVEATPAETQIALGEEVDPEPPTIVPAEPTAPPILRATRKPAPRPVATAATAAPAPAPEPAATGTPPAVVAMPAPAPTPATSAVPAPTPSAKTTPTTVVTAKQPPAPAVKPVLVPATKIESTRLAGSRQIALPGSTEQAMARQGIKGTQAIVKMCLSSGGEPTTVSLVRGTGFAEADTKIAREVRGWRYRPYVVDGKAVPVCTSVAFRYQIN